MQTWNSQIHIRVRLESPMSAGGLATVVEAHQLQGAQLTELTWQPDFETKHGSTGEQDQLGDLQRKKKMGLCSAE